MKEQLALWLFKEGGIWLIMGIPVFILAIGTIIWSWFYTKDSREELKRWKREGSPSEQLIEEFALESKEEEGE